MMKYSMNHPWKFRSWHNAYQVGLCQLLVVLSVEISNLAILNTNHTVLEVIMNFLALVIIADFDETFFMTTTGEPIAELIRNGELELEEKVESEERDAFG